MRNYEPVRNVLIHNPHSTRHTNVEKHVVERLDDMRIPYVSYMTKYAEAAANIEDIAGFVQPGDVIYSAAGDGTSHQVGSAVLASGFANDIIVGFGPYGNFNDGAHALGNVDPTLLFNGLAHTRPLVPIEIMINDRDPRTALFYATFGLVAIISHEFMTANRQQIRQARFKFARSLQSVLEVYTKNKSYRLPPYIDDEGKRHKHESDIMLQNCPRMGAVAGGEDFMSQPTFGYTHLSLGSLAMSAPYIACSMFGAMPNNPTAHTEAAFSKPSDIWAMIDGESELVTDVRAITATKRVGSPQLVVAHSGSF